MKNIALIFDTHGLQKEKQEEASAPKMPLFKSSYAHELGEERWRVGRSWKNICCSRSSHSCRNSCTATSGLWGEWSRGLISADNFVYTLFLPCLIQILSSCVFNDHFPSSQVDSLVFGQTTKWFQPDKFSITKQLFQFQSFETKKKDTEFRVLRNIVSHDPNPDPSSFFTS